MDGKDFVDASQEGIHLTSAVRTRDTLAGFVLNVWMHLRPSSAS